MLAAPFVLLAVHDALTVLSDEVRRAVLDVPLHILGAYMRVVLECFDHAVFDHLSGERGARFIDGL